MLLGGDEGPSELRGLGREDRPGGGTKAKLQPVIFENEKIWSRSLGI